MPEVRAGEALGGVRGGEDSREGGNYVLGYRMGQLEENL